jgi:hypothetical protein
MAGLTRPSLSTGAREVTGLLPGCIPFSILATFPTFLLPSFAQGRMESASVPLLTDARGVSTISATFGSSPRDRSQSAPKPANKFNSARFRDFMGVPARFLHMPRVPLHNHLLGALYQRSVGYLLAVSLLAFLGSALPFALTFYFGSCGTPAYADPGDPPSTFWRVLAVTFSGLAGMDIGDDLNDATHCVLIIGLAQFVNILLEGTVFSMIVSKLMNPRVHLRFSKIAAVITRDGLPHLSFRLVHPQGHFCSNFSVEATWIHREKTVEGETSAKFTEVPLNHWHASLYLPQTITHTINDDSPFFKFLEDDGYLSDAHGQLIVVVTAKDEVLNSDVWDSWIYTLCDVCHTGTHMWADCFLPGQMNMTPGGNMVPIADLDLMDQTVHVRQS